MLETIAIVSLVLLVGLIAAAAWAFRLVSDALRSLGQGINVTAAAQRQHIGDTHDAICATRDMLLAEIETLPKKGKPGRKPSASTGAKRGPKPKVAPPAPLANLLEDTAGANVPNLPVQQVTE